MAKTRLNIYFDPKVTAKLDKLAVRKGWSKSSVVEAAVESFLSSDHPERMEAALSRRLDRLCRQVERLEREQTLTLEALGLFVRFWLTVTPQIPPDQQKAAQAKGRERYEDFVEALGRRLAKGGSLSRELSIELGSVAEEEHRCPGAKLANSEG